jgi:hypothetical protein
MLSVATIIVLAFGTPAGRGDGGVVIANAGTPVELDSIGVAIPRCGGGHPTGFLVRGCKILAVKRTAGRTGLSGGVSLIAAGNLDLITSSDAGDRGDRILLRLDESLDRLITSVRPSDVQIDVSGHCAPVSSIQLAGFTVGRRWRGRSLAPWAAGS